MPIGSAAEDAAQAGISHLLEHMAFKGTARLSASEIASRIDDMGGDVNAYTEKDVTTFCARVLPEDSLAALDLLQQLVFEPRWDENDLRLEKRIVTAERQLYEDSRPDVAADRLQALVNPGSGFGRSVIGDRWSLESVDTATLRDWHRRHYTRQTALIAASGKLPAALVERLGAWDEERLLPPVVTPPRQSSGRHCENAADGALHLSIGGPAPGLCSRDFSAASVLMHILGGTTSSPLFRELREARGLSYDVSAGLTGYAHFGLWSLDADVEPRRAQLALDIIHDLLAKLHDEAISESALATAKAQLVRGFRLSQEDHGARLGRAAYRALWLGKEDPPSEALARIDAVSCADVQRLARSLFAPADISLAAIGPGAARLRHLRY